ncbi:MFS transporter [Acidihalobacter ferrooxydans]|uniref:MFS transporter n=1 Tax=Acidihalobacter ferrooxydans TaxID=1765967 RepID=A0A1P8UDC9_9GAMM|nr:MFS transporter [Acidihalobacter ferrooxydans]APZ41867.1 MFS transporter [Acidihalobacter ferrooxydans]
MSDSTTTPPPDARRAWRPFLLLAPFQFIFGLIFSWGAIAPALHSQAGWSHATLSLAFSLTPLALFPAVILAGRLLGRLSPKALLAAALALFTLGSAGALSGAAPLIFMIGYDVLALGVAAGLSTAACIAMVGALYPARRGTLAGALLALYGLSSIVSAPVFDTLDAHLGWRLALAVLLGGYAALGWLTWLGLPDARPSAKRRTAARTPPRRSLAHPGLLRAVTSVLAAAPLGALSFAVIGQLARAQGLGRADAVAIVAVMAFGNGLGRFAFGLLADRRGAPFSRTTVLTLNALAALLAFADLYRPSPVALAAYATLAGLSYGGIAGKLPPLAAHLAGPAQEHAAFGLLYGTYALGSFLGPLLGALIGLRPALTVVACAALFALLPACFDDRKRGDSAHHDPAA